MIATLCGILVDRDSSNMLDTLFELVTVLVCCFPVNVVMVLQKEYKFMIVARACVREFIWHASYKRVASFHHKRIFKLALNHHFGNVDQKQQNGFSLLRHHVRALSDRQRCY